MIGGAAVGAAIARRIERLEAAANTRLIRTLAARAAAEAGLPVEAVVAEAEAILARWRATGGATMGAWVETVAAEEGIDAAELRAKAERLERGGPLGRIGPGR